MSVKNFEQVKRKLQECYAHEDYQGALDLALKYSDQFPEHKHVLYYWVSTMAARSGNKEQALSALKDMLDAGFWYGEPLLQHNPSYQDLLEEPEFKQLVLENRNLQELEQDQTHHLLTIRGEDKCLSEENPCPLLLGLHANESTAQQSLIYWRRAAAEGWLVAVPQSSQAMWKGAYVWNNLEVSSWEIQGYLQSLKTQYTINPKKTIVAGHAMGGELAAWLVLTGRISARGFIAFNPSGPYMDDPGSWLPIIKHASGSGLKGYIILEENDFSTPHSNIWNFVNALNAADIPTELETILSFDREFMDEYENGLARALNYVASDLF